MKTIFSPAPFARFNLGRAILSEDPYLTQAERDAMLKEILEAMRLVKPIDDLIAWSSKNDPQLKTYLGTDWTRFFALSNSIAPLYKTVAFIADRLAETDAEYWYRPNPDEIAAVRQWTTGIREMYKIMQAHPWTPQALGPGMVPPPSAAPASVAQLPSAGPSTQDILLGAGAATGLGLLIYALVG
jgi:hypothetical protein